MQKSPITLLVFATICGSLQAGDMSVSGADGFSYTSRSGTPSGWNMDDSVTFTGSGELDNGFSVSYVTIDNDNTAADEKMTGQIGLSGSFGAIMMGAGDPTSAAFDNPTPPTAN